MTAAPSYEDLAAALGAITRRVRTDVTAVKRADGRQAWTDEALTPERMRRHLNGGPARGVCPIKAGESVTLVALLDFDSHGGETAWPEMSLAVAGVVDMLEFAWGMQPILFRSSGGRGVHLYLLWDEPQDAYSVRTFLADVLAACGLRSGTRGVAHGEVEVFPKQDSVAADGYGSQFILPLAGASVPLAHCELAGVLGEADGGRHAVVGLTWAASPPVPRRERPARLAAAGEPGAGLSAELRAALATLNRDGADLSYDEWRNVVFAIHHETGGSGDGLALAHEVSARSLRYDPTFLDERVWPYVHSERGAAITGRTVLAMARERGWQSEADTGVVSAFEVVDEAADASTTPGGGAQVDAVASAPPERRGIPAARHLTTDQANAGRLVKSFGAQVLVSAGRWYSWSGRHWSPDESDVYRFACRLSVIIRDEADVWRAKAHEAEASASDPRTETEKARIKLLHGVADALVAWARKSEMKGTIEAALGLVRKMLNVEAEQLDRNPWLLNVWNGTVDLRDGSLRPHDASDYITKLVRWPYEAGADAPLWERALAQITLEDGRVVGDRPVAEFLEGWFGYCATGLTREQKFVVHWGAGANGKSTVLDVMAEVLGDYAGTAAPGLLMASKSDRHPTELAHLHGLRMVTAHESGDGVVLREDMIKQATGGDKITARRMREDFFEFVPTHKLQLLTNHKPVVRGTDHGMWRRVVLVPYEARFGTSAEVAAGLATHERDMALLERLRGERVGILARVVRAAVRWGRDGLRPPVRVLAASDDYRVEQDRVAQFVTEVCEMDPAYSDVLTMGMGGVYPEYVSWCKDGGIMPLARKRFLAEVLRVVPKSREAREYVTGETGKRRSVVKIYGLRVLPE